MLNYNIYSTNLLIKMKKKYQDAYLDEVNHINTSERIFSQFDSKFDIDSNLAVTEINFDCLRKSISTYKTTCENWGEYDLKFVRNMALACEKSISVEDIDTAFADICIKN